MKKSVLLLSLSVPVSLMLQTSVSLAASAQPTNQEQIEFRVAAPTAKTISGARIVVIDDEGKIVATGLTDAHGKWTTRFTPARDKRFDASIRQLDTVTAMAFATGYNEQVIFEVPVSNHAIQPVILYPLQSHQRNEPTTTLGNLHRHDIIGMINKYAAELHLQRQKLIPGEPNYAPWSPATH